MGINILNDTGKQSPVNKLDGGINVLDNSLKQGFEIPKEIDKKIKFLNSLDTKIFGEDKEKVDEVIKKINELKNKLGKGFDDDLIISYINKYLSKIDQTFKTKIKALLNGESIQKNSNTPAQTTSSIDNLQNGPHGGGPHGEPIDASTVPATGGLDRKWGSSRKAFERKREVKNVKESKEVDIKGLNRVKLYETFLAYLDFKGYDKNSNFYQSIKTNLKFLKSDPFLEINDYKSIKIGNNEYSYNEFLREFIDKNIKRFINGEKISYVPNDEKIYKDIKRKKATLKTEILKSSFEEEPYSINYFTPIDDARDKIREIQKLSFDELYKNIDTYIKMSYIPTDDIEDQINQLIDTSEGDDSFIKYLKDNKSEIISQLRESDRIFEEYKKALIKIKNILDKYKKENNGQIPEDIKAIAEQEIKGIVSGMIFINGLHSPNFVEELEGLFFKIAGPTLPGLSHYINIYAPVVIIGLTLIGFTLRYGIKKHREKNFKNLLKERIEEVNNSELKKELNNIIKHLDTGKLDLNLIETLIKELSEGEKGQEIKLSLDTHNNRVIFNNLKKYKEIIELIENNDELKRDLKNIRSKLDIKSIFLSEKEFARDIISKIVTANNSWYGKSIPNSIIKLLKGYFGLGSIGEVTTWTGRRPMIFGDGNKYFKGFNAIKALDEFIKEYSSKNKIEKFKKMLKNIDNPKIKKVLMDKLISGENIEDIEKSIKTIEEIDKIKISDFSKTIDALILDSLSKNNNINKDKRITELLKKGEFDIGEIKMVETILGSKIVSGEEANKLTEILRKSLLEGDTGKDYIDSIYQEIIKYKKKARKNILGEIKRLINEGYDVLKNNSYEEIYEKYNKAEDFKEEDYKNINSLNKETIERKISQTKSRAIKLIDNAISQIYNSTDLEDSEKEKLKSELEKIKEEILKVTDKDFKEKYKVEFSRSLRNFKKEIGEIANVDLRNNLDKTIDFILELYEKIANWFKKLKTNKTLTNPQGNEQNRGTRENSQSTETQQQETPSQESPRQGSQEAQDFQPNEEQNSERPQERTEASEGEGEGVRESGEMTPEENLDILEKTEFIEKIKLLLELNGIPKEDISKIDFSGETKKALLEKAGFNGDFTIRDFEELYSDLVKLSEVELIGNKTLEKVYKGELELIKRKDIRNKLRENKGLVERILEKSKKIKL